MTTLSDEDIDFAADIETELAGGAKPIDQAAQDEADAEAAEVAEEQAKYVREGRRFVKEGADKAKKGESEGEGVQAEPQQAAPPKEKRPTWYKDEYGDWAKLPENFRNALREQERNAAQAIEKHSTAAKAWEPVNKLLEPHLNEMRAAGVEPQQYVSQLINADRFLRQDPVAGLNWIAQQYAGMDVIQLAQWMYDNGQQPQQVDPRDEKIAALEQRLNRFETQGQTAQQQAINKQIADWSADKPDFPAVRLKMAALAKESPGASLDQLYEEARWAHPEIRERILQEREDKRRAELAGKRQAGAQSPRGTPQPNAAPRQPRNKSWDIEADLNETFDELGM